MTLPTETTVHLVLMEVARIRRLWPWSGRANALAVLVEEVGEVARCLNDGSPLQRLREEAIQVAAVAIRIAEGDGDA